MDVLDDLLALAQVSGGMSVKCTLRGGWHLALPAKRGQALAHVVSKGRALLQLDNGQECWLETGDAVLLVRSAAHALSDGETAHEVAHEKVQHGGFVLLQSGVGDMACELFCLNFGYEPQAELVASLPDVLLLHLQDTPLQALLTLLQHEAHGAALATVSVVNALAQVMLAMLLRQYVAQEGAQVFGALQGWQQPRLRALVKDVLAAPELDWTVEKMAQQVHLSRAQFVRLFRRHMDSSPHDFVHKMRLHKAAMLLKQGADSVLAVALAVGFRSETHFGAAFKKHFGMTPKAYRMQDAAEKQAT